MLWAPDAQGHLFEAILLAAPPLHRGSASHTRRSMTKLLSYSNGANPETRSLAVAGERPDSPGEIATFCLWFSHARRTRFESTWLEHLSSIFATHRRNRFMVATNVVFAAKVKILLTRLIATILSLDWFRHVSQDRKGVPGPSSVKLQPASIRSMSRQTVGTTKDEPISDWLFIR